MENKIKETLELITKTQKAIEELMANNFVDDEYAETYHKLESLKIDLKIMLKDF